MKKAKAPASKSTEGAAEGVIRSTAYALPQDFCAIFDAEMNRLYGLALLLTGDHELAVRCYIDALEDCKTGPEVFREWALSWSRRAIIKRAILLAGPDAAHSDDLGAVGTKIGLEMHETTAAVSRLCRLERFVYVISVLEGYRVRECAILLNRSTAEVERARIGAMQALAGVSDESMPQPAHTDPLRKQAGIHSLSVQ